MGRYRPPAPKSSPYITRQGYEILDEELTQLWKRRAEVTKALSAAAAEGDRSENAEYIYRKKELRGIDYRIRYLQKRLPELSIVDTVPSDSSKVFFGAWVWLENDAGEEINYRIVGSDEIDRDPRHISMDGPLAKALFKKQRDDEVSVETPKGKQVFLLTEVRYDTDPESNH